MQKKYLLIIVFILTVLLILLLSFLANFDKISITTNEGEIKINDIYKNPTELLPNNDVVFKENKNYSLYYYPNDQSFTITILSKNLQTARDEAEKNFLKELNISEKDACKLKIFLGMPFFVNKQMSGKNFGLSFCPDGKPFPNQ